MRKQFFIFLFLGGIFSLHPWGENLSLRRTKYVNAPRVFTWKTIVRTIEQGGILISETGPVRIKTPWGERDLSHLNDVSSHYQGKDALYWLAMDLALAIKKGYLRLKPGLGGEKFDGTVLNKLPKEFLKMLGANKVYVPWRTYFRWKKELDENPGYRGDEGQVMFAIKHGIKNISLLGHIFGEEYDWHMLGFTLDNLKKAFGYFHANPSQYMGREGMKRLAQRAGISRPVYLYYIRALFQKILPDLNWEGNQI